MFYIDLITDHHTKTKNKKCYGAYVISKEKEGCTIGSSYNTNYGRSRSALFAYHKSCRSHRGG